MRDGLRQLISAEIVQRKEEGCDPGQVEERLRNLQESTKAEELEALWAELSHLEPLPGFPYEEPSALEEIRASSPFPADPLPLEADEFEDRMHGAWLGRCAGCLLGKPVEGWSKGGIESHLRSESAYPLDDYFPSPSDPDQRFQQPNLLRGTIDGMPRDDDIDYTVLGFHVLESHGTGVTSQEIGSAWLSCIPYNSVYTAERVAYANLVNLVSIPETATHRNPYREWIGAQIRADPWGYAHPGRPGLAAELAFRDARITHVKNGIYGSMMTSAMIAASFSLDDPAEVVKAGLSVIPPRSRLFEAVTTLVGWARKHARWQEAWAEVERDYGHYHQVHLYGGGDFSRTVCIAVMGGWDTDCNGATAGSILGAMKSVSGIPERWVAPLNDTVQSHVLGHERSSISQLAARMCGVADLA
jgi:ADP-ribosylglycohydrolase